MNGSSEMFSGKMRSHIREKVYKTMQRTGACSIAVGIIMLVTGVTVGIMSIVCGGLLLKRKGEITF